MSYDDGSFTIDDVHVVSVFPGKIENIRNIDLISIFIWYTLWWDDINGIATRQYLYSGQVMRAIYDTTSKTYTCFESVSVAYPVEILYI